MQKIPVSLFGSSKMRLIFPTQIWCHAPESEKKRFCALLSQKNMQAIDCIYRQNISLALRWFSLFSHVAQNGCDSFWFLSICDILRSNFTYSTCQILAKFITKKNQLFIFNSLLILSILKISMYHASCY